MHKRNVGRITLQSGMVILILLGLLLVLGLTRRPIPVNELSPQLSQLSPQHSSIRFWERKLSRERKYTKRKHTMALPNIVNTGTAGTAALAYTAWGPFTNDGGGNPAYVPSNVSQHDNAYLRWNPALNAWVIDVSSLSSTDQNTTLANVYYYSSGGQTLASGPVGTYAVGGLGAAPAPVMYIAAQVAQGTTGNCTLTGPATSAGFLSWKLTSAAGAVIAQGSSNSGGTANSPVNGYNLNYVQGAGDQTTGSFAAAVTLPAGATVQTGDVAQFTMGDGKVYQGVFDVTPAPHPQVVAGGPAVAVTFTTTGNNVAPQGNGVYSPPASAGGTPAQVSSANVSGSGPHTATQSGWTLTANSDYQTGAVQAPASATPGSGYLVQVGESSGYGYIYIDVVAGTGLLPPRNLRAAFID